MSNAGERAGGNSPLVVRLGVADRDEQEGVTSLFLATSASLSRLQRPNVFPSWQLPEVPPRFPRLLRPSFLPGS